ncbi:MAG: glycosyltransferase family 4 protein [Elusimicrobiota bacterium]
MTAVYFVAIVSALVVSLILTPFSAKLARRFGAIDLPDPRKVHHDALPRWGGIGIMGGFLSSLLIVYLFFEDFRKMLMVSQPFVRKGKILYTLDMADQLIGILLGSFILFVVGLVDDRKPINPGMKFLLQIIAAYVAMTYGVRIQGISIPYLSEISQFPLWIMQILTVLWIVGLSNAMNLIDGLDGLAGGTAAIISGAFVAVTLIQDGMYTNIFGLEMKLAGLLAACLLGATIGFLVYNFYPAQLFMGDSGALTVGFIISCLAVVGAFKTTLLAVLVIPFLLVAIPVLDMTVAFGRRLLGGKNPFAADRGHFHHRLLDRGWTQREIVFLVYIVTLVLAFICVTMVGIKKI